MSYPALAVLHLLGVLLVFTSLGAYVYAPPADRRMAGAVHGIGLLVVAAAGLALAPAGSWPAWMWLKAAVWVALGVSPVLLRRFPAAARPLLVALPLAGLVALWATFFKPGS